jgi:hypothetical protein
MEEIGFRVCDWNVVSAPQTARRINEGERGDKKGKLTTRHDQLLTDAAWLGLELEIAETNVTAHEWCRLAVLERLNRDHGLSKSERILFEQFARSQYLVTQGFQLLAEDELTPEEWKKFRAIANERISEIADVALAMRAKKNIGSLNGNA